MSNFQIALTAIFIAIFGFAVLTFSGIIKIGNSNTATTGGTVVVWGTLPQQAVIGYLNDFSRIQTDYTISYTEIAKETFDQDFIEALASDVGPDVLLLENDQFLKHKDKLFIIPYKNFPERTFRDTYVDGSFLYLSQEGILGVPVTIDPLVLYYNKNLFAQEGLLTPPVLWDDLARIAPLFTKKTIQGTIDQSAIALGESVNISHYKDILSLMFLQTGNPIVAEGTLQKGYASTLQGDSAGALADALRFYVSFSNPINELYSWNAWLVFAVSGSGHE